MKMTEKMKQSLLEQAKKEGLALSDEELADVAGGGGKRVFGKTRCDTCGWEMMEIQDARMELSEEKINLARSMMLARHKNDSPGCTCFKPSLFVGYLNPVDDSWLVE